MGALMMFRILLMSLLVSACVKTWAVGTADPDGDGFANERDACPYRRGVAPDGCPDGDGDGIADERDACPEKPGVAPRGCPFGDGDGDDIADERDACPYRPGVAPHGCPFGDRDGDKVADEWDTCPDEPGVVPGGCPAPDRDGDGVADERDVCADKPGVVWDGCPAPDVDGDGFADDWDGCEETPGVAPRGCPVGDGDGDGLLDIDDHCPFLFGDPLDDGCYHLPPPVCVRGRCEPFHGAFKGVRFERATELVSTARENLDDVAKVMNTYRQIRIELSGHADDREKNAGALSLGRAKGVYRHLVKQGVDRKRVRFRGAGASEPIADNETDEGRAKNRRVDITIITR